MCKFCLNIMIRYIYCSVFLIEFEIYFVCTQHCTASCSISLFVSDTKPVGRSFVPKSHTAFPLGEGAVGILVDVKIFISSTNQN